MKNFINVYRTKFIVYYEKQNVASGKVLAQKIFFDSFDGKIKVQS